MKGRSVQYYDVAGYLVGRWAGYFTLLITVISLCSTSIAQIVAISTGFYYIDTRINKLCALSLQLPRTSGVHECWVA